MSQNQDVLLYLKSGRKLTGLDALLMFDCFRLPARIWEIRKKEDVFQEMISTRRTKKWVARYWMEV